MTQTRAHEAAHYRTRLEPERHDTLHPELDAWRENVGSPIAIDAGPVAADRIEGIDLLCWNIAIGQGRLDALLDRLRNEGLGSRAERPFVILAQEAFRQDDTVPGAAASAHHGGRLSQRERMDVVRLAENAGLSLRYSPSMRNGAHPSDRGNAVLASVRLADSHAFLLPYVRQRRVAVSAQMAGHADLTFISAHLDTHGTTRGERMQPRIGTGRVAQAAALARTIAPAAGSVVVGADLNSLFGAGDPAVRMLLEGGLRQASRIGDWRHTLHRRVRLLLDHVLYHSPDERIRAITVTRVDEDAGDRTPTVFGSDHHPLLASIELNGA